MKPLLENAELVTDLEGNFFDLLDVGALVPPPPDLVVTTDPRLSDARNPLPASVVNASVNAAAAIVQSKLNLNGQIPVLWLGTTSTTAAQGDLAEYHYNKDQPFGYASLDGTGKLTLSELPPGAGTGTITSIGLTMPAQFTVAGSPVTTTGVIIISWAAIPDGSWFGNPSGSSGPPTFQTTPIPVSLVPSLDASKVASGILAPATLPLAVGVGVSHAPGAAPDPGATGSSFDYLARDMTYRTIPPLGASYQPAVPDPVLALSVGLPPYVVFITDSLAGVSLFYSIDSNVGGFRPVPPDGTIITLANGHTLYAYGAMAGYSNSNIVFISAPGAPPGELVTGDDGVNITGDDSLTVSVGP